MTSLKAKNLIVMTSLVLYFKPVPNKDVNYKQAVLPIVVVMNTIHSKVSIMLIIYNEPKKLVCKQELNNLICLI